jgi:hypothetical protein
MVSTMSCLLRHLMCLTDLNLTPPIPHCPSLSSLHPSTLTLPLTALDLPFHSRCPSHPLSHSLTTAGLADLLNGSTTMPNRRFSPSSAIVVGCAVWVGTGRHLIVQNAGATATQGPQVGVGAAPAGESDAASIVSGGETLATANTNTTTATTAQSDAVPSMHRFGVRKGRLTLSERDRVIVECSSTLCLVVAKSGEVWSCAHHDPYMVVWDASRCEHPLKITEFAVPWGQRGIERLVAKAGCVWAACRDGSVIAWSAVTRQTIMNVRDATIPISLLCARDGRTGEEVFGVAKSSDFTIVVWNA